MRPIDQSNNRAPIVVKDIHQYLLNNFEAWRWCDFIIGSDISVQRWHQNNIKTYVDLIDSALIIVDRLNRTVSPIGSVNLSHIDAWKVRKELEQKLIQYQ